jgi:hypothetical protein
MTDEQANQMAASVTEAMRVWLRAELPPGAMQGQDTAAAAKSRTEL